MLRPGDVLRGRYEIRDFIGRGGMADVYLALDVERQAEVAIKLLREDLAEEPEFTRRFAREAEALAKLDHPNIVHFYSFETDGRTAFIVMDYIRGDTLRGRLREANGPLPLEEVTRVLRQVGAALHYAHRRGIVHRDIKPANVMVRVDGTALLSDMGIARATEASTTTHAEVGTPAYMSPEQILGRQVGPGADVYALGIVLYEMVTGRRPFNGDLGTGNTAARRLQDEHLRFTPPDPRQASPSLPELAAVVILRALAKDPAQRWPDALSLVSAWEKAGLLAPTFARPAPSQALATAAGRTPSPSVRTSAPPAPVPPQRKRRGPWPLVAAGALLSLAAVVVTVGLALRAVGRTDVAPTETLSYLPTSAAGVGEMPRDEWGYVVIGREEPVRLGFAAALNRPGLGSMGMDQQQGAELAIQSKVALFGHPVELVAQDDECTEGGGAAVAEGFVSDPGIVAIVGHMCSESAFAALEIYHRSGYTMVSPSASGADLTTPGYLAFNRVCWNDTVQAQGAARFLRGELGVERVAIIGDGSVFGKSLAAEMRRAFEELGGQVVAMEETPRGTDDLRPLMVGIKRQSPQAVFYAGRVDDGVRVAQRKLDAGMDNIPFLATNGLLDTTFVGGAGPAAEGAYVVSVRMPEDMPGLAEVRAAYVDRYGEEPGSPFYAYAYDAVMVIMDAIQRVGRAGDDGSLTIGRRALAEAIRGTRDYPGISGPITCNSRGDCGSGAIVVWQVRDGQYQVAWRPQR